MRIVSAAKEEVTITISFDDLDFLRQGMREMLQALDDNELRILTGKTREQARALMKDIRNIFEAANNRE